MKSERVYHKISLSRKFFQYLFVTTIFSLILFGAYWIENRTNEYKKEVLSFKKTFSDIKRSEIKNKILAIKDFIHWTRNNPVISLSNTLTYKIRKLKLIGVKRETFTDQISQQIKDSIGNSTVPVYFLNEQGEMLYSSSPFLKLQPEKINKAESYLINHLKFNKQQDKGIILKFKKTNEADSVLKTITFYDKNLIPGLTVASIVSSENIEELLQEYIIDSLSRVRYARDEYLFINTFDGTALISNGRYNKPPVNIYSSGDTSWINIFKVEQLAASRPGGLFHTYNFQKISTSGKSAKTSYFSYLPEWKWIIGTGFYEDDVNSILVLKEKSLHTDLRISLLKIITILLILSLLNYMIVAYFSKRLKRNIEIFDNFFGKAADESILIDISKVNYKEFENIAEAVNLMVWEREKAGREIRILNHTLEERVAERTAQLVAINKELESFSYSISHDLRAPLRAIFGFSQIISTHHRSSLNEEGRKYMDYILEASIRMEQLINDLLNYSRLGRKSLNVRLVSLSLIVDEIHTVFKQKLEEIGGKFTIEKELPKLHGDESLLRQIFTNLIENAITYRRTDVQLEISISWERDNGNYIISISDNGIGIPEEFWEKIFNIFQRLHTEDKYPGTGIGLATVRKAVNMLDGTVWVNSVKDKGSTFYIKFHGNNN